MALFGFWDGLVAEKVRRVSMTDEMLCQAVRGLFV